MAAVNNMSTQDWLAQEELRVQAHKEALARALDESDAKARDEDRHHAEIVSGNWQRLQHAMHLTANQDDADDGFGLPPTINYDEIASPGLVRHLRSSGR